MRKPKKETVQGWAILAGLTLVFAALKITGVMHWGWLWVLAPLWLPIAVTIEVTLIILVVIVIQALCDTIAGGHHGKD